MIMAVDYLSGTSSTSCGQTTLEDLAATSENAMQTGGFGKWLETFGGQALNYLIRIGVGVLIIFVLWKVLKKFCRFIDRRMAGRKVDPSVRSFVTSVITWGIMILTIVEICIWLNIVEASTVAAIVAAAGVGISLAVQGTLSNFAGGILILALKPFRVGDYIKVPALNAEGTVVRIEMYYTTIEMVSHELVSLPNSSLTNNQVTNYSSSGKRLVMINCPVSYAADLEKAKEILWEIIRADSRMDASSATVVVSELGDSAVVLQLRATVKTSDYVQTVWDTNERVKKAFDEGGIEIPYNQLDVHIRES